MRGDIDGQTITVGSSALTFSHVAWSARITVTLAGEVDAFDAAVVKLALAQMAWGLDAEKNKVSVVGKNVMRHAWKAVVVGKNVMRHAWKDNCCPAHERTFCLKPAERERRREYVCISVCKKS